MTGGSPVPRSCTCSAEHWPAATVGCPVHHLMEDGAPACEHEVRCMCGNFADDRKCVLYLDEEVIEEDGPTCVDAETIVCHGCMEWADKQPHLTKTNRPVIG